MRALLGRTPPVVWSGLLAFLLTVLAGGVWTVLLVSNIATSPAIPWAPAVMAVLLWLMWQYLGGRWGSRDTSEARRRYLRATPLPREVFAWALAAGLLSIVALSGFWIVLFQLVKVPGNALPDFSSYPWYTVALVLLMAALVSSLAEEAGFRGYFQGTLERQLSGPIAIAIAALVIAPAHALTQGFYWPTMLWYFCVDVMFGTMAYLTKSILPGSVVHAVGLVAFFTLIWPNDAHRGLISVTGADTWFWIHVAQAIIFAALAVLAFIRLARLTRGLSAATDDGLRPVPAGAP